MLDSDELRAAFRARHGDEPRLFAAPGRVNLIGEHTDYNDGFVLPMAIERQTLVAARPRKDRLVRAESTEGAAPVEIDLDRPGPPRRGGWVDYLEGVARSLEDRGVRLVGADLLVASDVPLGAGLSSSAALEIATGGALLALAGAEMSPVDLALACQAAEHTYVGTKCGIMDQYVVALGRASHALLIDCRSLEATPVPLELAREGACVVVCDSKVKHELAASAYNARREECEAAVVLLARQIPGVRALRDVPPEAFAAHASSLPEPLRRRARHVVSENARTRSAALALGQNDLAEMGRLMGASHASLRDDYEVSAPELDALVEAASGVPGVFGARMTGGGFGGCTVTLVREEAVPRLSEALTRALEERFGRRPDVFVTRAAAGAREVS